MHVAFVVGVLIAVFNVVACRPVAELLLSALLLGIASLPSAAAGPSGWCSVAPSSIPPAELAAAERRLSPQLGTPPSALAHVHTEHLLPHQGQHDESVAAERSLPLMRDAALAWRAGGGQPSLDLATAHLRAWVEVYKPDFNPIDEADFDKLIETFAIVEATLPADLKTRAQALLRRWAAGYLEQMQAHENARGSSVWVNNWQSQRLKLVTMMATALGDRALFEQAGRLFDRHLAANLRADGSVFDFEQRDALHYVVGDLEPLVQAALAARSWGEDWYARPGEHGASLADAVRWLAPFARGDVRHEEFVHSRVPFDAERARAGVRGYAGPFDVHQATRLYWMAAEFDSGYTGLAQSLGSRPPPLVFCGQ